MIKKLLFSVAISLLVVAVCFWNFSSSFRAKGKALGNVCQTLVTADCNYVPVAKCGGVVLGAQYNIAVVTKAADYLVAVGGNTQLFMEIAQIAADADKECPLLSEVLDLAVMKRSESVQVLALAQAACYLQTKEQFADWQHTFDVLVATAEYASVEKGLLSRERN